MNHEATARISVMIPTRKRIDMLKKSIDSLVDNASSVDGIDILLAVDNDDEITNEFLQKELVPYLNGKDVAMRAFGFDRLGYRNLHEYSNFLARESFGEWLLLWNDDAVMKTKDWDLKIMEYTGQFRVLRFKDNHNDHPNSIFPCVPRDWVILFGTLSPHQVTDSWVSQIAYLTGIMQNCHEVLAHHNRYDLVGGEPDQVSNEREFLDRDPSNPEDLNHPNQLDLKVAWAKKLRWYLGKIGQNPGWFDKWVSDPSFDLWATLKENDVNNQCYSGRVEDYDNNNQMTHKPDAE
jgi:hypothetical protein